MSSSLLPVFWGSRDLKDWAGTYLSRRPRRLRHVVFALIVFVCVIIVLWTTLPPFHPPARKRIDAMSALQSQALEQARARYSLKNNRPPPPNYDSWFHFARSKSCIIDDYDQIHRDFEPFYQMAAVNSTHFQNMIRMGQELVLSERRPTGLTSISIKNGELSVPNDRTYFDNEWRDRIQEFLHILPDMDVLLNGNDEPRVVFDVKDPAAREGATAITDAEPFQISPEHTWDFFTQHSGCSVATGDRGFATSLRDSGFISSSSSSGFTSDLWPMLSFTKIEPCFSDILFPSMYHYANSWYTGDIKVKNSIAWNDKEPKLYWRGSSNGGHIIDENYRDFARFRLVKMSQRHPDIIDARMSGFWSSHCTFSCEADPIIKEYDIGDRHSLPREAVHKFKYALDVDGNTFSGRFLGLLKSGSLVFKSTAFQEHFSDWLRPYEHYIPVKVDLSDLVDRVQWAREHDEEARLIQQRGMLFAKEVLTDDQNNCYFAAVLLEWARLQQGG
ncbi:glycosyl transferase family 90-domain-containing protein [Mycena galopus ATCC 62051]|nr:glycosyl transferase family 90-domain-containing protein [Mycena galopus ATCC 62051]